MYKISLLKKNEEYSSTWNEFKKLQLNFIPQIGTTLTIKKDETYQVKDIEYNILNQYHFLKVEKL